MFFALRNDQKLNLLYLANDSGIVISLITALSSRSVV